MWKTFQEQLPKEQQELLIKINGNIYVAMRVDNTIDYKLVYDDNAYKEYTSCELLAHIHINNHLNIKWLYVKDLNSILGE